MAEEQEEKTDLTNIQAEALLVGSIYKQPDLLVSWSPFMRPKYDFSDEATRFYYEMADLMYKTFSQVFDETKVNVFMTQEEERLKTYRKFGGYKTITDCMTISDPDDFKNVFDTVKKFSLLREYARQGFSVTKILNHRKFNEWKPMDIYKLIRTKADKISTVIMANEESSVLNEGTVNDIRGYLAKPQMGLSYPWFTLNEMFRGCRLGKVVLNGFLSNEGKSRNLMMLMAYITLVKGEKFLLLSNEMSEEDLRSALITTVINNKCFKELHGIDITKPEKEIVLGQYRDADGNFIKRMENAEGAYIETEEEFEARVLRDSEEFRKVIAVGKWVEERGEKLIFFKDVGEDYSDERLEFEFRKHNVIYGIKYMGYDTCKGYRTDDWQTVKQTVTKLKELMKEINCFMWAVFQLTDDTVFTDIFDMSSMNIANAKQMKHVVDYMLLGKRLNAEEYGKYEWIGLGEYADWGDPLPKRLDPNKKYFAMICEKNRGGSKQYTPLFEYNLDTNLWANIGSLMPRN